MHFRSGLGAAMSDAELAREKPSTQTLSSSGVADGSNSKAQDAGQHRLQQAACSKEEQQAVTHLGSMLWQRRVNGVRVIPRGKEQTVAGLRFEGYGSSCSAYPHHYLTAAAALGGSKQEVGVFVEKLQRAHQECRQSKT